MGIGTLLILVGVVLLFTLSMGIILSHRNSKSSNKVNVGDHLDELFENNLKDDEII